MSARVFRLLLSTIGALCLAKQALAWGATGHEYVSGIAAELLPDELPAFVRTPPAVADIAVFGRELDRSKGSGKMHDAERDPGHFVALDDNALVAGVLALETLPPTREAYDTLLRPHGFTQYSAGYLPYAIVDGWQQLVKDFAYWRAAAKAATNAATAEDRAWFDADRQRRERLIVRDLGVWSHYVGDASQPLHVTEHFNGWGKFPNPRGFSDSKDLHARFEGQFVHDNVERDAVKRAAAPYRACTCTVWDRMRAIILESQAMVVPLYELEQKGAFSARNEPGIAFVTQRLAAGASTTRDMIVDAWRASPAMGVGYPEIKLRDIESGKRILTRDDFGRD